MVTIAEFLLTEVLRNVYDHIDFLVLYHVESRREEGFHRSIACLRRPEHSLARYAVLYEVLICATCGVKFIAFLCQEPAGRKHISFL